MTPNLNLPVNYHTEIKLLEHFSPTDDENSENTYILIFNSGVTKNKTLNKQTFLNSKREKYTYIFPGNGFSWRTAKNNSFHFVVVC